LAARFEPVRAVRVRADSVESTITNAGRHSTQKKQE
jgi:hypothetical protein